jgi:AraC-like DNA-binding protein
MRHTRDMRLASPSTKTPITSEKSVTPLALFEPIVRAYAARGMDPTGALAAAQIRPTILKNPKARISAWQMERISGHAMRELDDESLGWSGRRLPWGSYGMLIRASLSAPTLGVALKRWCRHHGLICDNLALHVEPQGACVVLSEIEPLGNLREFCMVSLLRNLHGVACWLIDSRLALQRSEFPYPEPAHADVYPLIFPGAIRFIAASHGPAQARLWFDPSYLDLPIRRDEKALRLMLQRALPLQVLPYRRDRLLLRQVRQALLNRPEVSRHAAALAQVLGLSVRTLHRQLREEGTCLQALKDEVRQDQACEWLQRSQQPIKQIAEKVGFRNEKSFIRAFKTWTGQSPAAWRQAR